MGPPPPSFGILESLSSSVLCFRVLVLSTCVSIVTTPLAPPLSNPSPAAWESEEGEMSCQADDDKACSAEDDEDRTDLNGNHDKIALQGTMDAGC